MYTGQEDITQIYLSAIENELQKAVDLADELGTSQLHYMLSYHMGWTGRRIKPELRGKRIRPLLVLLTCSAAGGDWKKALPAAAAVEIVHNFSLIHDDIEDHSSIRRGRLSVWKKWGIAQAINAGDAMFTLAHLHTLRLEATVSQSAAMKAVEVLQQACLYLTQGQYMDLSFEKRNDVTIDEYWSMVEGKTAALISACTELGAITACGDEQTCASYRNFGKMFGLAFQVQDDILGIWGDTNMTGKSNLSDLITRKKTLPILYGLSKDGKFAERWSQGLIHPEEMPGFLKMLENDGGKIFAMNAANEMINKALISLDEAHPVSDAGQILKNLTLGLLDRKV